MVLLWPAKTVCFCSLRLVCFRSPRMVHHRPSYKVPLGPLRWWCTFGPIWWSTLICFWPPKMFHILPWSNFGSIRWSAIGPLGRSARCPRPFWSLYNGPLMPSKMFRLWPLRWSAFDINLSEPPLLNHGLGEIKVEFFFLVFVRRDLNVAVWPSVSPKLTQLSILTRSVHRVPVSIVVSHGLVSCSGEVIVARTMAAKKIARNNSHNNCTLDRTKLTNSTSSPFLLQCDKLTGEVHCCSSSI